LSPERIDHAYVYLGTPEAYLARTATESPDRPTRSALSERYLARIPLGREPVGVMLQGFNPQEYQRWTGLHPDRVVAPGLAVVEGPILEWTPPPPIAVPPYTYLGIGGLGLGALVTISLVGLGWSLVFFGRWVRPVEVVALAPAVGIAVLILGGVLLDRIGLRLSGATGVMVVLLVAASGWAIVAATRRSTRPPASEDRELSA
jgi:hypothetical protein